MEIEGRHCAFNPCFGMDFVNNHTIQDIGPGPSSEKDASACYPASGSPSEGNASRIHPHSMNKNLINKNLITYLHPRIHYHPNITQIFPPPPYKSPEIKQLLRCKTKNLNQSSKLITGNKTLIEQKMHYETHTNSSTRNKPQILPIKKSKIMHQI